MNTNNSIYALNPARDNNKQCGLRAAIYYTDKSVEYHYVPFNTDLSGKQFVSLTIVPNPTNSSGKPVVKTVKEIVITCAYEANANTAVFDNISLVREITQTMEYDDNGNLIKTVTGSQGVFQYTYDTTYKHRLTSVTNRASESSQTEYITQSMTYDGVGNVTSTTLSGPGDLTMSTSAQYTNQGNLLSAVTDATGSTVTYGYGTYGDTTAANSVMWGLPTSVTAPNGTVTRSEYDLFGRVTKTNVDQLATLEYNYDDGNLETITRTAGSKSQIYSLSYDAFGRTTSISVGNSVDNHALATYEYLTGSGLLHKQTYGNGHTVSFTYDDLGRTKTATYSDGTVLSYAYTGDGQLHSVTETKGENVTVYVYQYDTLGNLVGSEKFSNDLPVLRTWHSYNNDNRLSSQGWQIGTDSFSQTYAYDTWDGNLSSIVHEGVNYSGKTVECNYTYEYDVNGNITAVSFGNRRQTYVYDDNNQLIRENNDRRQYTQTWEYDEFGNITSTSKYAYTTGELGEPTSTVTYGYTDSDWGDLLTQYNGQAIEYDEIGNPLYVKNGDTVVKSYTWSKGRQLATHMTKGVTWNYSYDISGLRTQRTNGTTTYEYIYAGDKLVRMVKNGEVVDFGYAGNQLSTLTYDGTTYYYVLNGQGDVLGLTDSTGKMVIGYIYSAYGIPTPLKADETLTPILKNLNPFMYRGYVYDIESGLYYLQSRYYDPEMGRFINADAYASTGQGVLGNNMFAYCGNNPANYEDRSGSKPGDLFESMDEAAYDAAFYINEKSISENAEYGAHIYVIKETYKEKRYFHISFLGMDIAIPYYKKITKVYYTYDEPVKGSDVEVILGPPDDSMELAAFFHTHAAYSPNPNHVNDDFSPADFQTTNMYQIPSYLATPYGTLRRYDPADETNEIIYYYIPYDPNHPRKRTR